MLCNELSSEVWIGVDLGTTGVRAIAYTLNGQNLGASEAFYPLLTPHPDWAEENPHEILDAVFKVLSETSRKLHYQNVTIAGIALSTVMHSFAGLDNHREPLMNLQTWADSRSADIIREMKLDASLCRRFYEKTGCPIHACYPLAKVIWLQKNRPEIFKQTSYIGSIKDYLFYHLTGEWVLDRSTASTSGMYNEKELCWDDEILAYAGLQEKQLPKVVPTTYAGKLTKNASESIGLKEGLPIVIGATDGVLVNLGIGAVKSGQLSATIGTSGALRMLTPKPQTDKNMRTWCYNLIDNMWVSGGAINNGGMILRWMRDNICHFTKDSLAAFDVNGYDLMTLKASHINPGSDGLIMMPCFTGERAPYWNSELRGLFFGLSLNHSRSHMIRATMEGICYSMNAVLSALREFGNIEDIRISGSFTKSELWIQILSDVLNEPLTLPNNSEGAAYGACILGFLSTGKITSIEDTQDFVKPQKIYQPIASHVETYQKLYNIFEHLYQHLQPEFKAITDFQKIYNIN